MYTNPNWGYFPRMPGIGDGVHTRFKLMPCECCGDTWYSHENDKCLSPCRIKRSIPKKPLDLKNKLEYHE